MAVYCGRSYVGIDDVGVGKVKGKLRALAARGIDTLHDAIADALTTVTPADCVGFSRHCGYTATLEGARL